MRGDHLVRQPRIIRAIEASPKGLNAAEVANRRETGIWTICRYLEAPQAAAFAFYTGRANRVNRWAFIGTLQFKTLPPFILDALT